MLVIFLSEKRGFCMKKTSICMPFCKGGDCITLNQERVDFETAKEACHDRNGELVSFQPETYESILDIFSQELHEDFWIGLRLPAGACSNLSAPLRGYKWTSGSTNESFTPSTSTWRDSVKVCSPHCVSLSGDRKWTERLCSEKTNGFVCRTKHKDACQAQEVSDEIVFQSSEGCVSGPCEHQCTDVKGGYKCSCFRGYIPNSKDPRRCELHCSQEKCPAMCDRNTGTSCLCPNGFLLDGKFCVDINECLMDQCDQECQNTFGSFVCSCKKGFVLKNQVKCISEGFVVSTPIISEFVKPASNNTQKGSSASSGRFLWIWIFVAVAVLVLIFVIRFYVVKRQKRREQQLNQESSAPAEDTVLQVQF